MKKIEVKANFSNFYNIFLNCYLCYVTQYSSSILPLIYKFKLNNTECNNEDLIEKRCSTRLVTLELYHASLCVNTVVPKHTKST